MLLCWHGMSGDSEAMGARGDLKAEGQRTTRADVIVGGPSQ